MKCSVLSLTVLQYCKGAISSNQLHCYVRSITTLSLTNIYMTVSMSFVSVVCLSRRYNDVVVDCVAVWERRGRV